MEAEQLYVNGKPIFPAGNYENDEAKKKIDQLFKDIASVLLEAKAYADSTYAQAAGYTDVKIARLINGAPSTLDTLKEIADAMAENKEVVEALDAAIGTKAADVEFQAHAANDTVHTTITEKNVWNEAKAKADDACTQLESVNAEISRMKTNFQDGCRQIYAGLPAAKSYVEGI